MGDIAIWRGNDAAERIELRDYIRTLNDAVRRRAFEIYESRRGASGSAIDDWAQAEREVLGRAAVDVAEDAERVWVRIALPGLCEEDIDLHVFPGFISCYARTHRAEHMKGVDFYVREVGVRHLYRAIHLPHPVLVETAEACLHNGLLELVAVRKNKDVPVSPNGRSAPAWIAATA